jgi:hypothetical protein
VTRVDITRPNEWAPARPQHFTLERKNGVWTMTSPTPASVRVDEAEKLVTSLASLKAESIVAQQDEISAFGLHEPAIRVSLTMANTEESAARASESKLAIAQHDGKIFAFRGDGSPIYELNKAVFDQLTAEFRTAEGVEFESKDVDRLTLKSGDESNSFVRKNGNWVFESEPDLPIDSAKIDKILTELKAIKPDRFAAYASDQLAPYGLEEPHYELSIALNKQVQSDAKTITLSVSEKSVSHQSVASPPTPADPAKPAPSQSTTAGFAMLSDREGVFLLNSDTVKKIFRALGDLEKM